MGLDMFLDRETSFFNNKLELKVDEKSMDTSRLTKITEAVGYWRKFNEMHDWIVRNIQGGNDDQGRYWIDEESVLDLCEYLDKLRGKSNQLDQEITMTIQLLTSLIGDDNITEFSALYYTSSW